uniref:Uncharacterized protein n=1 Tax=Alexandrium catenella TaxID=2925 RepID=A0A7S1LQH5_ALECA|mmetsp:Transcript_118308/g.314849  ORF Transcript_118308/g.314849 Transcript_118308/m.314849 type:complete len:497 (+) Transcript_118308:99-1589(+)
MSGPVAGAPVVHGPPPPDPHPTPASVPEAKAPPKPASSGAGASPASGSKAPASSSAGGSRAAPASTGTSAAVLPGSVPAGTVARITGLKAEAAKELNGQLCQLLRPADSAPDRIVVRTRQGEKSLKPANLQFGASSVYPRWALAAGVLLAALSVLTAVDALLGSRSALSAAAIPVLAMVWLLGTVCLQLWVYRPCRTPDVWVPSVSELGLYPPLGHVYRFGFLHVALLLATSVWLYSELLLPRLAEVPAPGTPWNPVSFAEVAPSGHEAAEPEEADVAPSLHEVEGEEPSEDAKPVDAEVEAMETADGEGGADDAGGANGTNATSVPMVTGNMSYFLTWAPNRSVTWGYAAAAAIGVQGLITFDSRISVRSAIHVLSMGAFAVGTWQHSTQASMVLMSPRGRPLAALSDKVHSAMRLRQNITNYGPLVMLGLPLGSQLLNMNKPPAKSQGEVKAVNILKESGMIKLVSLLQWALVVIYAVFYSSFCVDFWFASQAP